jgi:hypothetical protein
MSERILIVAGTSIAYFVFFYLNGVLFAPLAFSIGVSWIFLPSGLRLAFVLIFGRWGAIGIFLGTVLTSLIYYETFNPTVVFTTALISGFSPLLARQFARQYLGIDHQLQNFSARKLIQTSALFAAISASLHQVFFAAYGLSQDFAVNTLVMAAGDFTGTLIILYVLRYVLLRRRLKAL